MLTFRGHSLLSFDSEESPATRRIVRRGENYAPGFCTKPMRPLVGGTDCAELTQLAVAAATGVDIPSLVGLVRMSATA